jgi:hypothetical protein
MMKVPISAICDLCSKKFEKGEKETLFKITKENGKNMDITDLYIRNQCHDSFRSHFQIFSIDICPECAQDLKEFLQNKNRNIY